MIVNLTPEQKEAVQARIEHVNEMLPGLQTGIDNLLAMLKEKEGPNASIGYSAFCNALGSMQSRIEHIKRLLDESQEVL